MAAGNARNWRFDGEEDSLEGALRDLFREIGTQPLDKEQTRDLRGIMVSLEGPSCWKEEIRWPRFPPGSISLMVPNTYLHINVKRTLFIAAITLISLKIPIAAVIPLLGQNKMGVAKLSPFNGEFCNYCVLCAIGPVERALAAERIAAEV